LNGAIERLQLPREKCPEKARAKAPKPPRVTPAERESEDVPGDERPDDESPPKKLDRDDHGPPWPPPPDEDEHVAPVCEIAGAAIPGDGGVQLSRGITA
jgi:hypothetical protein